MNLTYQSFLETYKWLLDIYAVDYYVSENWSKIPEAWQTALFSLSHSDWANILRTNKELNVPLPEDFIQFRREIDELSFDRDPKNSLTHLSECLGFDTALPGDFVPIISTNNILRFRIKKKKLHEIEQIIAVLRLLNQTNSYDAVIDVGAGLGHLSRMVACFFPKLLIGTVEGNENLVETASALDDVLRRKLGGSFAPPQRKLQFIRADDDSTDSIRLENNENLVTKQLLLGLHACGDLSSLIIKSFVEENEAVALVLFCCCYHKINGGMDNIYHQDYSEKSELSEGFPLSQRYKDIKISYTARELACHAKEQLIDDLLTKSDFSLAQRCFRPLLEYLLQKVGAGSHGHVKSVKISSNLDFQTFVEKGLSHNPDVRMKILEQVSKRNDLEKFFSNMESDGKKIFIINCLRTMVAPVVEAVLLKDRISFIEEKGFQAYAFPIFDPIQSPRNIVIIGKK